MFATCEQFSLKRPFVIARGKRIHVDVIRVTLEHEGLSFEGECTPTPRYGESVESVLSQIASVKTNFAAGDVTRKRLLDLLPPGAAATQLMPRDGNTTSTATMLNLSPCPTLWKPP